MKYLFPVKQHYWERMYLGCVTSLEAVVEERLVELTMVNLYLYMMTTLNFDELYVECVEVESCEAKIFRELSPKFNDYYV